MRVGEWWAVQNGSTYVIWELKAVVMGRRAILAASTSRVPVILASLEHLPAAQVCNI